MNKINYNISEMNSISDFRRVLGITGAGGVSAGSLPYSGFDATCGIENEFQTAVKGRSSDVDLPLYIRESRYLRNLVKRAARGDLPGRRISEISEFIENNRSGIWENSWVRFPRQALSSYAESVFISDLKADKSNPASMDRKDAAFFQVKHDGADFVRVPVSYLLKLALADAVSGGVFIHPLIRCTGENFLSSFLNDNTSPEIVSFFPVKWCGETTVSSNIAQQNLKSYLLTQMLVMYANKKFELTASGQEVSLYFSPHPPVRQKRLNELVTDSFYRELFMSPCLSGWDRGEEKHAYMNLCHQVLSRSSLNSALKLKEAGILSDNRIYLKGISNISLANNGTHISIGSIKLNSLMKSGVNQYGALQEKYFGDLAIKIYEHFIPLFTGIYTAAPYRLGYEDFHPEKVLGFLTHELDYTYVRMIWRRWIRKADVKIFGNPVVPFGPEWFERFIARTFRLRGDYVNDFRLIDYLVALLSTDESPALNGIIGNDDKLKQDLVSMGIFDSSMSVYTLYRLRSVLKNGYTGFEGRYYSLFHSLDSDVRHSVNLQLLITALAYRYILTGEIKHSDIDDSPVTESERRQILFGISIGIPVSYIRKSSGNVLMAKILSRATGNRNSSRYQGYIKINNNEYRKGLLKLLREEGSDIIESLDMEDTMRDLELRVREPELYSASAKITSGVLHLAGEKRAIDMQADDFNLCAEKYYRENLRERHMSEALDLFIRSLREIENDHESLSSEMRAAIHNIFDIRSVTGFAEANRRAILEGSVSLFFLRPLIHLLLVVINKDMMEYSAIDNGENKTERIPVTA